MPNGNDKKDNTQAHWKGAILKVDPSKCDFYTGPNKEIRERYFPDNKADNKSGTQQGNTGSTSSSQGSSRGSSRGGR